MLELVRGRDVGLLTLQQVCDGRYLAFECRRYKGFGQTDILASLGRFGATAPGRQCPAKSLLRLMRE